MIVSSPGIFFAKACTPLFHNVIDPSPLTLVQHQPSDFSHPTSDIQLQPSDLIPQTSNFRLQTSDLIPQTSNFRLQTSDLIPQSFDLRPQTSDFRHHPSESRKLSLPSSPYFPSLASKITEGSITSTVCHIPLGT